MKKNYFWYLLTLPFGFLFYYFSSFNYLLLHTLIEIFTIFVEFSFIVIIFSVGDLTKNRFLSILAYGYPPVIIINILHTLTFKGLNIFSSSLSGSNITVQFWVLGRFFEVIAFCYAIFNEKIRPKITIPLFYIFSFIGIFLIIKGFFPVCFIEGRGLTAFKICLEILVILIYLFLIFYILKSKIVFYIYKVPLIVVFSLAIINSFSFIFFKDIYSFLNFFGHYIRLIKYIYLLSEFIIKSLRMPFQKFFYEIEVLKNIYKENYKFFKEIEYERMENFWNKVINFFASKFPYVKMIVFMEDGKIYKNKEIPEEMEWYERKNFEKIEFSKGKIFFYLSFLEEEKNLIYKNLIIDLIVHWENLLYRKNLEILNLEIKKREEYRINFLRAISHELKTPLNIIYGNIQLMEMGVFGDNSSFKKPLYYIKNATEEATKNVNTLNELSKLETGTYKIMMESLSFSDFKPLINEYKVLSKMKKLKFYFDYKGPEFFSADYKIFSLIISNLLSNAIKNTEEGEIRCNIDVKEKDIIIKIFDTGKGLPETIKEKILKPESIGKGGLGLIIIKKFIDFLKGEISFETSEKGTTFYVKIPKFIKPAEYIEKEKIDILIIDSHEGTREMLKELLKEYRIKEAENGSNGFLMALEHLPTVVICDYILPDISGEELIYMLKKEKSLKKTKFILYTGKPCKKEEKFRIIEKDGDLTDIIDKLKILISEKTFILYEKGLEKEIPFVEEIIKKVGINTYEVGCLDKVNYERMSYFETIFILIPENIEILQNILKKLFSYKNFYDSNITIFLISK